MLVGVGGHGSGGGGGEGTGAESLKDFEPPKKFFNEYRLVLCFDETEGVTEGVYVFDGDGECEGVAKARGDAGEGVEGRTFRAEAA